VKQLGDFSTSRETILTSVSLRPREVSEANLYDALIATINRMQPLPGRRAIVLVSSCVDSFSKASYQGARAKVSPQWYSGSYYLLHQTSGDW